MPKIGNNTDPIIYMKIMKFGMYMQMTTDIVTIKTLIRYFIRKHHFEDN